MLIEEQPVPQIDTWAFDLADPLQTPMLVDVAKVVTVLGAYPTTVIAALATAIWAVSHRHRVAAVGLVAGVLLSDVAVHAAKDAYDRPRPSASLVETSLSAYPSGHALQSVTWIACAIVLVRGGAGWASRIAAVTVAIAIVAAVCATHVFLRADYLTDVLGGVALGVAVWAAVGVIGLVAGSVVRRDRSRRSADADDRGAADPHRMTTLHEMIDQRYEVGDTRLMYGITVPLLIAVASIALFLGIGGWWMLAPAMLSVIALTAIVTIGIGRMLIEEESSG
jgi:membrane-associated phospholipid phosphatase